jgi:hypothetical protein
MHEVRARKVRRDGIHFQSLRYLSLTLAAYVGEEGPAPEEVHAIAAVAARPAVRIKRYRSD